MAVKRRLLPRGAFIDRRICTFCARLRLCVVVRSVVRARRAQICQPCAEGAALTLTIVTETASEAVAELGKRTGIAFEPERGKRGR